MKTVKTAKMALMLTALAVLLVPGMALAVGTSATGTVDNTATLSYSVSSVPQTDITNTVQLQVDRNVAFAVARVADGPVSPGLVNGVLEYTVTNLANDALGFTLNYESVGGTPIGMTTVQIWIESGATAGFQDTEDGLYTVGQKAFNIADSPAGISNTVYIVADTPIGATSGQTEIFALIANVTQTADTAPITNTAGANTNVIGTPDNVLADGAGTATGDGAYDGSHSDSATYTVSAAAISVNKTFQGVYSDPINGTNGNQKAIPGAVVEYQIQVSSQSGAGFANAILGNLVDDLGGAGALTLTTYGAGSHHIEMDCVITAGDGGDYACSGSTVQLQYNDAGITNGASLTLDMPTLFPAGSAHGNNGELNPGESVTFRYMMLIQ